MIPGMGHDLPPVLWNPIIEEIVLCAQRAREAMTARAEINQLQKEEL
jgi:hypothetical protein